MKTLTVLYDDLCEVCVRSRTWMESQRAYVPLEFISCRSSRARARFGEVPWLGEELVVVSDEGEVWAGPAAFLVCLWALEGYRDLSYTLGGELLAPLASRFFRILSSKRRLLAALLPHTTCPGGACRSDRHTPSAYR
jgi:predicted DCC family thiol-disulfide oxidoreductase YuxK